MNKIVNIKTRRISSPCLAAVFLTACALVLSSSCAAYALYGAEKNCRINSSADIKAASDEAAYFDQEIIKRAGLKHKFQIPPEKQINSFFKKHYKYLETENYEKLKELYSEDFVNNDGLDKTAVFELSKTSSQLYKDIKYNFTIEDIKLNGKYASVKITETADAKTGDSADKFGGAGTVQAKSVYIGLLTKESGQWKLSAANILSETALIKYGAAAGINAELTAPDFAPAGSKYDVFFRAYIPENITALGSISNAQIEYPQPDSRDIFRLISKNQLARVLTANKENKNEYVTASIALAQTEPLRAELNLNLIGAAFIIKRINILTPMQRREAFNGAKQQH